MDRLPLDEGADARPPAEARSPQADRRTLHAVFRPGEVEPSGGRLGWKVPLAVLVLYALVIVVATYPRIVTIRTHLTAHPIDPLQHLWVMNWYKSCVAEGKSHVYSPDIQYPVGAPLANFSPMLFQSLFYIPLSTALGNDILSYNILWFSAFVFTGFSIFVLAWTLLRDRLGATFAGLAGMLCTPIMIRGHGHLELMFAGSMCLFLASWIRWVDRPGRSGLFATAGLYLMSSLCAAYFAVLAVVPAVIYVAWRMAAGGPRQAWPWLRRRVGWFAGFLALVVPGLLATFSAQIWAVSRGISMHRSLEEFERYGGPIWAYVIPTFHHALYAVFPFSVYDTLGYSEVECASYLGVVTLLLIGYSASRRVSFRGSRYLWFTFAAIVVLSMGGYWKVGQYKVPLPGLWLREYVPVFRSIRAPSRFNLLACGIGAVLAGSGLAALLAKYRKPWARGAVFLAASTLLVADLSMVPFWNEPLYPPMPGCYSWIRDRNPHAALLELPLVSSGCPHVVTTTCASWQSKHRLRTSAGYSGFLNAEFDDLLVDDSPFSLISMWDPARMARPDSMTIGIVPNMALTDYAWMVAARARFDYIVLHRWDPMVNDRHPSFAMLKWLLRDTLALESHDTLVYNTKKLPAPTRPALFCEKGWRVWREREGVPVRVVEKTGQVAVYAPESARATVLAMEACSYLRPRKVVLREGDRTLARWEIGPGPMASFASPPLDLAPGMHTLTLESDGDEKPASLADQAASWDIGRYSLKLRKLEIRAANP